MTLLSSLLGGGSSGAQSPVQTALKERTAAKNKLSSLIDAYSDLTPTHFFDPTATGSSGAGTYANPFTTQAQITAAMIGAAGNYNREIGGWVFGIKRGITITSQLFFDNFRANSDVPFVVCPYGNSGELPVFELGSQLSTWSVVGGYSGVFNATLPNFWPVWQGTRRIYNLFGNTVKTLATIATWAPLLQAAGAGYCVYCDDGKVYAIPYDNENLNLGQVYVPNSTILTDPNYKSGLQLAYAPDSTWTGSVTVAGLAFRHGGYFGIKLIRNTAPTVGANSPKIIGCDFRNHGVSVFDSVTLNSTAIVGNAISTYGCDDTVRMTNQYIAGNYFDDIGNNTIETSYTDGTVAEFNLSKDAIGHGIIELWQSNSNSIIRYNEAHFPLTRSLTSITVGAGYWNAALTLGSTTVPVPAQNKNNVCAFNLVNDCAANAFKDWGSDGAICINNTFIGKDSNPQFELNTANGGGGVAGASILMRNNAIHLTGNSSAGNIAPYIYTGTAGNTVIDADNNNFSKDNQYAVAGKFTAVSTNYASVSAFNAVYTKFSATTNRTRASLLDSNGRPASGSPLVGADAGMEILPSEQFITGATTTTLTVLPYMRLSSKNFRLWKNGVEVLDAVVASATTLTLSSTASAGDIFKLVINPKLKFNHDMAMLPITAPFIGAYQREA
jgi:hypothetical protein